MLRNLSPAPEFTLQDDTHAERTLAQIRGGRPFLLLFSRFAECPTSRRDLLAYANVYDRIRSLGADMAAITVEPPEVHRGLRIRLGLPFPLLSDPSFEVSDRYGVYSSDETDEGPQPHGEPAVFVLDLAGNLACSQICTGPKGIADPAEMTLVLLYMVNNGGRYW